jgi:hypothetical protein
MRELVEELRSGVLTPPSDLDANAARDISGAMNAILADVFALYFKTKTFTGTFQVRIFTTTTSCSMNRQISYSR